MAKGAVRIGGVVAALPLAALGALAALGMLAACNAITGVSDLLVCTVDCDDAGGDGDGAVAFDAGDAGTKDGGVVTDAARDTGATDTGTDAPVDADTSLGCNGDLACERVVFVTSTAYTGNLGGIAGADAKCNTVAATSSLPRLRQRRFLAWVSTGNAPVATRFPHGTLPYVRPDGQVVATQWAGLVSGTLVNGIGVDEKGAAANGNAWTGTNSNGGTATSDTTCNDWTSDSLVLKGMRGNVGGNGGGWSSGTTSECSASYRLYCFEH